MIAVVQRVTEASVSVEASGHHAAIGPGLCVLLCVETGDNSAEADWMAGKLARLRIFSDDQDRMNRSIQETRGEILLISQFTLAGESAKGNRPSFIHAAPPDAAARLCDEVARRLRHEHAVPVKCGEFGAIMAVKLVNDGPVTIILTKGERHST